MDNQPTPALIALTPVAVEQVRRVLREQGRDDAAVRVYIAGRTESGFQYGLALADGPDADDLLVEQDGLRLVVDLVSAPLLHGARLDFVDAGGRRGFAVIGAGSGAQGGCAGGGCSCGRGGCGRR
jgi:iron-sulfur cluster assembly accessory protein